MSILQLLPATPAPLSLERANATHSIDLTTEIYSQTTNKKDKMREKMSNVQTANVCIQPTHPVPIITRSRKLPIHSSFFSISKTSVYPTNLLSMQQLFPVIRARHGGASSKNPRSEKATLRHNRSLLGKHLMSEGLLFFQSMPSPKKKSSKNV